MINTKFFIKHHIEFEFDIDNRALKNSWHQRRKLSSSGSISTIYIKIRICV